MYSSSGNTGFGLRRGFIRRQKLGEEMSLQITSMADVFTILLVFLLKSYASGAMEVQASSSIELPRAKASDAAVQALKVEVSDNAIVVEGQPVAVIHGYAFDRSDLEENGVSRSLRAAFLRERARENSSARRARQTRASGSATTTGDSARKVLVIADERAPYSTIKTVLASAASLGFTDVKLAVDQDE